VFDKQRHAAFPDVPTAGELGIDISGLDNFRTIAVPAATPEPIVAKLEEAVLKATSGDDWKAFCEQTYTCIEPVTGDAAQQTIVGFRDLIAERLTK
jgi:tripartite-type tricarboxylate transporter receptor subunit TctC